MRQPPSDATLTQIAAANPETSTWLAANAGSGKTRVLTDRVARLLLRGVPPQRILCLTYTRAAATEMQNRLFKRLGAWAMAEDGALKDALDELGLEPGENNAEVRGAARTLFARAIETPGGLKLQTIHSFCASLLRRFPLEAHVSPSFMEMDDRSADMVQADLLDQLASGPDQPRFDQIAALLGEGELARLTKQVIGARASFEQPLGRGALCAEMDIDPGMTLDHLIDDTFAPGDAAFLQAIRDGLLTREKTDLAHGQRLEGLDLNAPSLGWMSVLEGMMLFGGTTKTAEPFSAKIGKWPTAAGRKLFSDDQIDALDGLMARIEGARQTRVALEAVEKSVALHAFADWILPAYAQAKTARGWLDFDDLILKTRALLTDPSVAQWVLFRLDGGIDHILVDEGQDTSPVQWQIIRDLAREFASGDGARPDIQRTIFVVGDPKQSIYSFQGADPAGFEQMRAFFEGAMRAASEPFQTQSLLYSFRSANAVLQAVDATFKAVDHQGLGMASDHVPFHSDMPGRVDLWAVELKAEAEADLPFDSPVDALSRQDHRLVLARRVVDEMAEILAARTQITTTEGVTRPVTAGDFLILVQSRKEMFHEIIRACKDKGLPVAGADRLRIGGELAVRDLMALLRFAATPEDDLSLATVLRSPLCNWTEAQLFDLAHKRDTNFLWRALRGRKDAPPATMDLLQDTLKQGDFLRPFDLIDRILTRHRGRKNLLARLGMEAEDGVDALLAQALSYEQGNVPSLTGFIGWMAQDTSDLKRALDQQGDRVRVMTVHGAKGLEAPIVILPDCAKRKPPMPGKLLKLPDGPVLWRTSKPEATPRMAEAMETASARDQDERMRLLYVAMTRAENWLIIAAAGDADKDCWYAYAQAGLGALGAAPLVRAEGIGLRWQSGVWPDASTETLQTSSPHQTETLPDWAGEHAGAPPQTEASLSPSQLGGAKVIGPDPEGLALDEALARGTALHWALEHFPKHPLDHWDKIAAAGPDGMASVMDEARAVLAAPALTSVFAQDTLAEVSVTAELAELGNRRISGQIDRLIISAAEVIAVDFKSNAAVPTSPTDTPEGLLRQMGAYHAALAQLYPDRKVTCAILWTRTAELMPLDDAQIRAALVRTPTS